MATPPLSQSNTTRYINANVTKCYYLPDVAAANLTPTRAEMNAGTDLSFQISDINGWLVAGNDVETPDLGTTFTSMIPGRTKADSSSITLYAATTGVDVRTLLPRGTAGFIMWCDGGDVAGQKADVFPIRVRSNGKSRSTGEDPAKITVECSITAQPAENVTIPA